MNKTQMANKALQNLGVSWRISDFDNETTNHAKLIRNQFQQSLDTVTEAHEWSFATKSRDLPLLGDGHSGWLFKYNLPADCLVLRQIGKENYFIKQNVPGQFFHTWQFDNSASHILCNLEEAWGKYTRKVMEDEDVPNYFGNAVAAQLSMDIAAALIGDKFAAIKTSLEKSIKDDMDRAIVYDIGRQPDHRPQVSSYELLLQ